MIIVMRDGSTLHCGQIDFMEYDGNVIADEYRIIPINEILKIIPDPEY